MGVKLDSTETLKLMRHTEDDSWPRKSLNQRIDDDESNGLIAEAEAVLAQWEEFLPVEAEEVVLA